MGYRAVIPSTGEYPLPLVVIFIYQTLISTSASGRLTETRVDTDEDLSIGAGFLC